MKTADLTMEPKVAAAELAKWKHGKTVQDQLITKAYRAIARGGKLIDLHESFKVAGCDELGRPKLAFGRADSTWVRCFRRAWSDNAVVMKWDKGRHYEESFSANLFAGLTTWKGEVEARVPIIPPQHRRSNLAAYYILFEAAWGAVTDDPMLLEPLGGSLYRVVAHWDLTVVEQAVLRGRL